MNYISAVKWRINIRTGLNICTVMDVLDHEHNTTEWRLFIDSSKASLKSVLLNNGNTLPSVPVVYVTDIKEIWKYEDPVRKSTV